MKCSYENIFSLYRLSYFTHTHTTINLPTTPVNRQRNEQRKQSRAQCGNEHSQLSTETTTKITARKLRNKIAPEETRQYERFFHFIPIVFLYVNRKGQFIELFSYRNTLFTGKSGLVVSALVMATTETPALNLAIKLTVIERNNNKICRCL